MSVVVKVTSLLAKAGSGFRFSFGVRGWTQMEIRYVKSMYKRKPVSNKNNSVFKGLLANITWTMSQSACSMHSCNGTTHLTPLPRVDIQNPCITQRAATNIHSTSDKQFFSMVEAACSMRVPFHWPRGSLRLLQFGPLLGQVTHKTYIQCHIKHTFSATVLVMRYSLYSLISRLGPGNEPIHCSPHKYWDDSIVIMSYALSFCMSIPLTQNP